MGVWARPGGAGDDAGAALGPSVGTRPLFVTPEGGLDLGGGLVKVGVCQVNVQFLAILRKKKENIRWGGGRGTFLKENVAETRG